MKIKDIINSGEERTLFDISVNGEKDFADSKWYGEFNCQFKNLTTLEGGPSEIFGNFKIAGNDLKSLKGSPRKIRGCYDVSNNQLKNLEGVTPDIGSYFSCSNNNKDITSLKNIHK